MHLQLDHVFVAVPHGCEVFDALAGAGFLISDEQPHPGQGTASRGVFFANAYLELIWLVNRAEAAADRIRRTHLLERTDPASEANPFGLCFRATAAEVVLPFETWEYRPPYLPAGWSIPVGANSERLDEPLLFFLSWRQGPPPDPPAHPNSAQAITRVAVEFPAAAEPSQALGSFAQLGLAQLDRGPDNLLRLELDHGRCRESIDLRPQAPLLLSW